MRRDAAPAEALAADVTLLTDASRVFSAAIALSLADAEDRVTLTQLRALVVLSRSGPMNVTRLSEALGVNRSNASRVCDQLEHRRLVRRTTGETDRRNVLLETTSDGVRVVRDLLRRRQAVLKQVVDSMAPAERAGLLEGLAAFVRAADRLAAEGRPLHDGDGHLLSWLA